MKYITICFFITINISYSQGNKIVNSTYDNCRLKDYFVLYKNAILTLDINEAYLFSGHKGYYFNWGDCVNNSNNVAYQYSYGQTSKDSIIGKIYFVNGIYDKNRQPIGLDKIIGYVDKVYFELVDTSTKVKMYYVFDPNFSSLFPFSCIYLDINNPEFYKSRLEKQQDPFTNVIKINSPETNGNQVCDAIIYKYIKNGVSQYKLSLRAISTSLVVNRKGVTILFTDKSKIFKPNVNISVYYSDGNYVYDASIVLTQNELIEIQKKSIRGFRLYAFDNFMPEIESDLFKLFCKAIVNAK